MKLLKIDGWLKLPLTVQNEDKNYKKKQGEYHHPGVQQKYGRQRSAERSTPGE